MTAAVQVAYCSTEDIAGALDVAPGSAAARRIPRAIYGASTSIEGLLNRRFYPMAGVRYFDWPLNYQYARPWVLWLDADEAWSVDQIVTGSQTLLPGTHFILRPENAGPPYSRVEILTASGSMWAPGNGSWQQAIAVHGTFGGCGDTGPAGALASAIATPTATTITVSDAWTIGTLDTILIDTEWMTVTGKSWAAAGGTLAADIALHKGATQITPSGGTYHDGETILIGAEKMRITDQAGGTLIVDRAVDGTILAAHTTGATIYAPRTLTVTRGALGSTAATHANSATIARLQVPALVRDLAVAYAVVDLQQDSSGWTTTKGEGGRVTSARDLDDLQDRCYTRYARQSRIRAV